MSGTGNGSSGHEAPSWLRAAAEHVTELSQGLAGLQGALEGAATTIRAHRGRDPVLAAAVATAATDLWGVEEGAVNLHFIAGLLAASAQGMDNARADAPDAGEET